MEKFVGEYENLTDSERNVFTYVFQNQEKVSVMKINDLAEETAVSKTVVINMCQKLGFDGFGDLKYYLKGRQEERSQRTYEDIQFQCLDQVKKTMAVVDRQCLKRVASAIIKTKTVYIVARGTSKAAADYLEHLLLLIGIKCINLRDYNLNSTVIKKINMNESVILISLSGETRKIVEVARIAKARSATVIALTGFFSSTIGRLADYTLYCSAENADTRENDINSRLGMFVVIDMLVTIVKEMYEENIFK